MDNLKIDEYCPVWPPPSTGETQHPQPRELRGSVHHITLASDADAVESALREAVEPLVKRKSQKERLKINEETSKWAGTMITLFTLTALGGYLVGSLLTVSAPVRRSSVDVDPNRAETFKAPKRYDTEPYLALNKLMSSSPDHQEESDHLFKPNDPKSDQHAEDHADTHSTVGEQTEDAEHKSSHKRREHKRVPTVQAVKDLGHALNEHSKHSPGPRGPHVP